ncbi:MAG: hypothetical protein H0Z33_15445 [Bacillaceae bacterium]|nr:hypothetical protein [Bacillaceae bacterium]
MKTTLLIKVLLIILFVTSCSNFNENTNIPKDMNTVQQLMITSNTKVGEYSKSNNNFILGEVWMETNEDHQGKVVFTYVDFNTRNKPIVIEVTFDTLNNKYLGITKLGESYKLAKGPIDLNEWKVDSDLAQKIAMRNFNNNQMVEKYYIKTNYVKKIWSVWYFYDDKKYFVDINPFTGKVVHEGIKDSNYNE